MNYCNPLLKERERFLKLSHEDAVWKRIMERPEVVYCHDCGLPKAGRIVVPHIGACKCPLKYPEDPHAT